MAHKHAQSLSKIAPNGPRVRYEFLVPVRWVAEPALPLKAALGRAVQRLRTAAGYSAEQLGTRAGLRPIDIVAIERGERNLPLTLMERLAAALDIRVSDLLADAERERVRSAPELTDQSRILDSDFRNT